MSLSSSFDSVVTDFCVYILQNRASACSSCVYLQVSKGHRCRLVPVGETLAVSISAGGMGDGGAASVLPLAGAGRVHRAQRDLCLSLRGCGGIGSVLC